MPAPRRAPTVQEINTAFSDMSTEKQAMVLESLTSIHRILKRERSRTAPLPTEWIERDVEKESRLSSSRTFMEHEQ